jgi:exodeoxyribonuclease VII large subunit
MYAMPDTENTLQAVPPPSAVLTVSELNSLARRTLEQRFPLLKVAGEISNLTRASSGHVYFTLKDEHAQVRCTMWRNKAQLLSFRPDNGMQVEARALVTLYEVRGDFQLAVESLRQAGAGNLFEAFLRLKSRLEAEGLFDAALKRAVPKFPRRIGIITSPAAAALQDVLVTLGRRAPNLQVVLYPAAVQGGTAASELRQALVTASARAADDRIDLILLVRGGGSIEDLNAFNDEELARVIRASTVPVISGVGHETDFTIADFAADVRAATPTGAAELASSGYFDARQRLVQLDKGLRRTMQRRLESFAQRLDRAALRLRHPRERIGAELERCDHLGDRLTRARHRIIERNSARVDMLAVRVRMTRPDVSTVTEHLERVATRLAAAGRHLITDRQRRAEALAIQLELLDPQAVLGRGYSIARDSEGQIIRSIDGLLRGQAMEVQIADGCIDTVVEATRQLPR